MKIEIEIVITIVNYHTFYGMWEGVKWSIGGKKIKLPKKKKIHKSNNIVIVS